LLLLRDLIESHERRRSGWLSQSLLLSLRLRLHIRAIIVTDCALTLEGSNVTRLGQCFAAIIITTLHAHARVAGIHLRSCLLRRHGQREHAACLDPISSESEGETWEAFIFVIARDARLRICVTAAVAPLLALLPVSLQYVAGHDQSAQQREGSHQRRTRSLGEHLLLRGAH